VRIKAGDVQSFTINTAVIVAIQMLVLRLVRRHRRSSALAAIGLIWAEDSALRKARTDAGVAAILRDSGRPGA
jgi:hypothetical protein